MPYIHGAYQTRLYRCWQSMRERVRLREDCELHPDWDYFPNFKKWSLDNGYSDKLLICRNGDVGNYEPGNVRWDTRASNTAEALAKSFTLVSPKGTETPLHNLSAFCRENGLDKSAMHRVISGKRSHHKQWTVKESL